MALLLGALTLRAGAAPTYYVSPFGNDNNSGLSPDSPWKSATKVSTTPFDPGTQVLFQRGGEWREHLLASSSGTPDAPIVYGAYGTGAKPKFWGSDVLNNSGFQPLAGSSTTYTLPFSTQVNSVLIDQQFSRSAELLTGGGPQDRINFVKSTPGTWFHNNGTLYLNTGGVNPAADPRRYTAAVRDELVNSNYKNYVHFRDLVVDESAKYNAGNAFKVMFSRGVQLIDTEAYRAGKHHYSVINSTEFVGRRVYGAHMMPDQGFGGASGIASFSDWTRVGDRHEWHDARFEQLGPSYPAFVTHGEGIGEVVLKNLVAMDSGVFIAPPLAYTRVRMTGGFIQDGPIDLYGEGHVVEGVEVVGELASINLAGKNMLVQNNVLRGYSPSWGAGHSGAVKDLGHDNIIRFNTFQLDEDRLAGGGGAIAIHNADSRSQIYGNIFGDIDAFIVLSASAVLDSHDNFFVPGSRFFTDSAGLARTLAQWQALGFDLDALVGDPRFADRLAGDLSLLPGSPALDQFTLATLMPGSDINGVVRPRGAGGDLGAYELLLAPEDLNGDGRLNILDYLRIDLGHALGLTGHGNGDANLDGAIDAADYLILDRAFLRRSAAGAFGAAPGAAVPEPAAAALLAAAGVASLRRRRRGQNRA